MKASTNNFVQVSKEVELVPANPVTRTPAITEIVGGIEFDIVVSTDDGSYCFGGDRVTVWDDEGMATRLSEIIDQLVAFGSPQTPRRRPRSSDIMPDSDVERDSRTRAVKNKEREMTNGSNDQAGAVW